MSFTLTRVHTYNRVHAQCTRVFWRLTLCVARAICLVNSVMKNLSFGLLAHSKLLERSIHLQRRSSYSFFELYTCLYHESWHGVLSPFLCQIVQGLPSPNGRSTADLCWKEVKDKDLVEALLSRIYINLATMRTMIRRTLRITIYNILYNLTLHGVLHCVIHGVHV